LTSGRKMTALPETEMTMTYSPTASASQR
jgi:hypothetical protein